MSCDHCVHSEQEEGEGSGLSVTTPNFNQLDDLGRSSQASQDICVTLTQQIRTAMTEVSYCPESTTASEQENMFT